MDPNPNAHNNNKTPITQPRFVEKRITHLKVTALQSSMAVRIPQLPYSADSNIHMADISLRMGTEKPTNELN